MRRSRSATALCLALLCAHAPHVAAIPTAIKIVVRDDRMARVAGADLAAHDLNWNGARADKINLYNQGRPVPIAVDGLAADGALSPESAIIFWGEAPRGKETRRNPYTRDNVYKLELNSPDPPKRFLRIPHSAPPGTKNPSQESFLKTLHLEQDIELAHYQQYIGAKTDRVMWTSFSAPSAKAQTLELPPIANLFPNATGAKLRLYLWGASNLPKIPDHDWKILFNGSVAGRAQWDDMSHLVFETELPSKAIKRDGKNILEFSNAHADKSIDKIWLDWVELEYRAPLDAQDDRLEFTTEGGFPFGASLGPHFSSGPVRVFEGGKGCEYETETWPGPGGIGLLASLTVGNVPDAPRAFRAVGPTGFAKPNGIASWNSGALPRPVDPPDYLIVSHHDFLKELEPLVKHRQAQGMKTACVDVEDVYNKYTNGMFDPNAIRLFIDDLLGKPGDPPSRLRHVFLVGDATYDYFNIRGGTPNFVPTWHTDDTGILLGYSPTIGFDDYFVSGGSKTFTPRIAIGRLPSNRVESVRNYVEKTLEFEKAVKEFEPGKGDPWLRRATLIGAKGFERYPAEIAAKLRGWDSRMVVPLTDDPEAMDMQRRLIKTVGAGCGLMYFAGHGAYYMWRTGDSVVNHKANVLTDADVQKLSNRDECPIVLTSTCFSTLYDAPLHDKSHVDTGIGIFLAEAARRGAIAVIGNVGKVSLSTGHRFSMEIIDALQKGAPRLGDAFLAAKKKFVGDVSVSGMELIGDPALDVGRVFQEPNQ